MMYVCHVHMWYGCTHIHVKHVMICGDGTRRMSCVAIYLLFIYYTARGTGSTGYLCSIKVYIHVY
jgi:hypothetical protein